MQRVDPRSAVAHAHGHAALEHDLERLAGRLADATHVPQHAFAQPADAVHCRVQTPARLLPAQIFRAIDRRRQARRVVHDDARLQPGALEIGAQLLAGAILVGGDLAALRIAI